MRSLLMFAAPASLVQLANAMAFPGPAPTPVYAAMPDRMLQARQAVSTTTDPFSVGIATCGWDKISSQALTCPGSYSCALYTATSGTAGMAGCCIGSDEQDCNYARACYDYADISTTSLCNADCFRNSFIRRCTGSQLPYCQSWTYPGLNIKDYGCGTDGASSYTTILSTVSTQSPSVSGFSTVDVVTTLSVNLLTLSLDDVTGWQKLPTATSSASSSSSTTSAAPSASSSHSSGGGGSDAGAIAGGVVGGVVGAALLAGLAFFFWRRHRKNQAAAAAGVNEKAGVAGAGVGTTGAANTDGVHELGHNGSAGQGGYTADYKEAPAAPQPVGGTPVNQEAQELHAAPARENQVYEMGS